jgi:predicted lipid carrier protein YhbT
VEHSQSGAGGTGDTSGTISRTTGGDVGAFFGRLASRPHPQLHDVVATIRIDLQEDDSIRHWYLAIDHGTVTVSRRNARADAVMKTDRALFERVVTGEANALTAALRSRLRIEGDARLLVAFKRVLPGPPGRTTTLPASSPMVSATARTRVGAVDAPAPNRTNAGTSGRAKANSRGTRKDHVR